MVRKSLRTQRSRRKAAKIAKTGRKGREEERLPTEKPEGPEDVDQSVGDAGGEEALAIAPGASVEDPGDGGEEDVAPVEGAGFVVMREAEDDGGGHECTGTT